MKVTSAAKMRIADRAILHDRVFRLRAARRHACWREDVLRDVIVVRHPTDTFDHATEENEAVIAVVPLASGLEGEWTIAVQRDVIGEGSELEPMGVELRPEDIAGATRVREQLVNRDLRSELLVRVIGDVRDERCLKLHLASL